MDDNSEMLEMELSELYSFARHHFQLYLNWYTFFLTVNFAAIGWFTSVLLTGALKKSLPIIFIAAFFIAQLIFSYIASVEVRRYFEITHSRSIELLSLLSPGNEAEQPQSPIPLKIYVKIISLMCQTLISFGLFWTTLTAVSIYLVPL